jgi:hypothetical protein
LTISAAGDQNNIVDAVRISVEGVIYGEDGILLDERVLQVVNLNVDDSYYDPNGAQLQVGTVNRDLLPIERPTSLTYIHAEAGNDTIGNYGEMTRSYGEAGADEIDSSYTYDIFDGSTLEEIAAYALANGLAVDSAAAQRWAIGNRLQRALGYFNDWADGGAGDDYLFGGDGEDYLSGGDIDCFDWKGSIPKWVDFNGGTLYAE